MLVPEQILSRMCVLCPGTYLVGRAEKPLITRTMPAYSLIIQDEIPSDGTGLSAPARSKDGGVKSI